MGFANVVTAAVDSDDPRIKGACMIILEEGDPGTWDRGTPTKKLVHQLSSTRDPVLNVRVPANRIIGGYTIKDGVIIPRYSHSDVIEAVFSHTRVTVGLMTSAKLLSAVEPVIMYQRRRFRGGEGAPGTPRYELGLQQKEDVLHRLVDVWATGEASASLGFEAARLFDDSTRWRRRRMSIMAGKKLSGRAAFKALSAVHTEAIEYLALAAKPEGHRDEARLAKLRKNPLLEFVIAGFPGQRALPGLQAVEHRPRRQHDARSRQPHGRLRRHGGLPGLPRPEVDGRPARSHLRRPGGGAAFAALHYHDQ